MTDLKIYTKATSLLTSFVLAVCLSACSVSFIPSFDGVIWTK